MELKNYAKLFTKPLDEPVRFVLKGFLIIFVLPSSKVDKVIIIKVIVSRWDLMNSNDKSSHLAMDSDHQGRHFVIFFRGAISPTRANGSPADH